MSTKTEITLSYRRMDVYRLARVQVREVHALARQFPRGYAKFADQAIRASGGCLALIGEGVCRFSKGQKRQRYEEARSEAGEAAAHIEAAFEMGLVSEHDLDRVLVRATRICSMLTRMIQRQL